MIPPERRAEIRRLFYAEHWRIGTIATELGLHHETVRAAVEVDHFARPGLVRPSELDPYHALIIETLTQHPKLRTTRLHEMLRVRGYRGSVVQVRRLVARIRPRPAPEAFLRLTSLPGEEAQVDWGHFGHLTIGRARRPIMAFVMVLSHARAVHVEFFLDQAMESFLLGHVRAFDAFGGVPRRLLYGNFSCGATLAHQRRHPDDNTKTVAEALQDERRVLIPLPQHAYDTGRVIAVRVEKQPYVRFDGNRYSVPHGLVRMTLTLVATTDLVRVLDGATEVARHDRSWSKGEVVEDLRHVEALWEDKRAASRHRSRSRLITTVPRVEELMAELADRNEPMAAQTRALNRLLDEHGATLVRTTGLGTGRARRASGSSSRTLCAPSSRPFGSFRKATTVSPPPSSHRHDAISIFAPPSSIGATFGTSVTLVEPANLLPDIEPDPAFLAPPSVGASEGTQTAVDAGGAARRPRHHSHLTASNCREVNGLAAARCATPSERDITVLIAVCQPVTLKSPWNGRPANQSILTLLPTRPPHRESERLDTVLATMRLSFHYSVGGPRP